MAEIDRNKETDLIIALRDGKMSPYDVASGDISASVALQMVRQDGSSIQLIPEELRDHEIYREAILNGGDSALAYIDSNLINPGVDYDDMTYLQQQVADAIETRSDWESNVRLAREGDVGGLNYIPKDYHESLIENADIRAFADSGSEGWVGALSPSLLDMRGSGGELLVDGLAYQVMERNPNLIKEFFEAGILDENDPKDIGAASYILSNVFDYERSGVRAKVQFGDDIDDLPAGVWNDDLMIHYITNISADADNQITLYEEHTGNTISNKALAEIALKSIVYPESERFDVLFNGPAKELVAESLDLVKRFYIEVGMGEHEVNVRSAAPGEDPMIPYAEALIKQEMLNGGNDEIEEMVWNEGLRLDAEKGNDLEAFKQQVEQIDAAKPDFTPVDDSLAVARNEAGEVEVSFKLQDKQGNEFEYTMNTSIAQSLQGEGGELADAAAYGFVSDQSFEVNRMIDQFNGQELKIEGIAVDHEEGMYFATFNLEGQPVAVSLDNEDLSINLSELNVSDAQAEHLAVMVAKEISEQGITPPMGIERAEELTQELGEALRKDAYLTDNGTSYQLYVESGDSDTMISKASYSSLTQACEGIGEMVNEARMEQSLAIQREEVEDRKHEVKQEHKQSSISM